jgi:hypothetical protein
MLDLYPDAKWNFCLGEADIVNRVGVFSFARANPSFPALSSKPLSDTNMALLLLRSAKTCIHELFHIFGAHHCQYYNCLMQGANSVAESDAHSFEICPVCLHKMILVTGGDIATRYSLISIHLVLVCVFSFQLYDMNRYRNLSAFYQRDGASRAFAPELIWLRRRMELLKITPVVHEVPALPTPLTST